MQPSHGMDMTIASWDSDDATTTRDEMNKTTVSYLRVNKAPEI